MTAPARHKQYDGFESKDDSAAYRWLVEQESRAPSLWYTREEISWGADMSRSATNRHLLELTKAGNVSRKSGPGGCWLYRDQWAALAADAERLVTEAVAR